MALQVINKTRTFMYNKTKLVDPDPQMSPMAVADFHCMTYPELVNAKPQIIKNEETEIVYEFKTTFGTKG